MSTWPAVLTIIMFYLAVIFGLKELVKDRAAFKLRTHFCIHNMLLSLSSLVLLAFLMEDVVKLWYNVGPTFLHVFHHSKTALLVFVHLDAKLSGVAITWIEYLALLLTFPSRRDYYYFATAGGVKLWWKKHLTTMQILQFIIDIFLFYFGMYQHFAFTYWPQLPHYGDWSGDPTMMIFGSVLITSFLGLFANFTYTKDDGIGKNKDRIQVKVYIDNPGSGRK
ncbi:hypothetical protein OG21DRAFT_1525189 [Imleria badia]|nr:hypothetical protein OG21DRAFT_1525189 [Imleria badia]